MRTGLRAAAASAAVPLTFAVPALPALGAAGDELGPGQVVTLAGTGERGYSGDGGDARDARFDAFSLRTRSARTGRSTSPTR